MSFLTNLISANGGGQREAYKARVYDLLVRIKQELGVDELLLAIEDAKKIASSKVEKYLTDYATSVNKAVAAADAAAFDYFTLIQANNAAQRSGRNIEKITAMQWKAKYEVSMEDVNAQMPLAQQIVSKYMSNFGAKPKA